ncbi:MAG: hypothetical protein QM655_07125 [Nocardioidaceae bacterium]
MTVSPGKQAYVFFGDSQTDSLASINYTVPTLGSGALYASIGLRTTTASKPDGYRARLRLNPDGTWSLAVVRVTSGTETVLARTTPSSTLKAGQVLTLQSDITGTSSVVVRMRAWAEGTTQPEWQLSATDTAAERITTPGYGQAYAYLSSSASTKVTLPYSSPTNLAIATVAEPTASTSTASATPTASPTETAETAEDSSTSATVAPSATATATATSTTDVSSSAQTLVDANFDSLSQGSMTAAMFKTQVPNTGYNNDTYFDDTTVIADPRGSGNVMRVKLDANTYHSSPAGNNGLTLFLPLSETLTYGCISYDIRFAGDFYWSAGGKLPGLEGVAPGVSPSVPTGGNYAGASGWSGRAMWLGPTAYKWAGPTNMGVSYLYNPNQTSQYGDNISWDEAFTANTWHTVKMCYTMNTVGSADGQLETWLDGDKVVDNTTMVYRLSDNVGISHFILHVFRGGNTSLWTSPQTDYIDFDNFEISGS